MRKLIVATFTATLPLVTHAYVGPGLGLGAIGVVLGLLLSVILAVLALFWYPIKRLLTKRARDKAADEQRSEPGDTASR